MDIATNTEESEALAGSLPTFPSLKSSLYQSRRSRLPPLPQSPEAGGARRQKRIERELKIKTLADELANGHRGIDSYISAIRHCVVFFDFS